MLNTYMTYEDLTKYIEESGRSYDMKLLDQAYELAAKAHDGQMRRSGEPYICHPLNVAKLLVELGMDSQSIAAALLHDVVEDTAVTLEEIKSKFGPDVALLVDGVTKLTKMTFSSLEEQKAENLRKMLLAMSQDVRVMIIKLCDRVHNMRTGDAWPEQKRRDKALETMEVYAPIAHRLGISGIKEELEDRSLRYLDPVGYNEINNLLDTHGAEFLNGIRSDIREHLKENGIEPECIKSRVKSVYGIYRKMYMQRKNFDEIYDIYAVRIILDNVAECYNALGQIHDMYHPLPNRFKDYISTPKPNGYQSLHTTVIGREAIPFEVQIRTNEMDRMAEYGVAAHWKYKAGVSSRDRLDERLAWVRQLLEIQREADDSEELLRDIKSDLLPEEVFAFTPRGDVINLPAGATAIDFAYAIHSAVGNRMIGAKVNNRIVTLDHVLKNGDIVEILTSKNAKGPSRDWMKIAKSNEARSKIRQWFKKEKRDENIANGRSAFDAELRHCGIAMKDVLDPEFLPVLLKKVAYPTLDDLYAAIGYGGFTAQKAVSRIQGELQRRQQQRQQEQMLAEAVAEPKEDPKPADTPKQPKAVKSEQGIIVEGLDNCLVKFSKCCTPVPGDDIVGFITRGYGVSVHRADCPNASEEKRKEQPGRWIHVSWGTDTNDSYPTTIEAVCKDRLNLLLDISSALSTTKTFVLGLNTRSTEDGFAIIRIEIQIKDGAQLSTLMNKLHQISGVLQVNRPVG